MHLTNPSCTELKQKLAASFVVLHVELDFIHTLVECFGL